LRIQSTESQPWYVVETQIRRACHHGDNDLDQDHLDQELDTGAARR
jgi:hypothetical protein